MFGHGGETSETTLEGFHIFNITNFYTIVSFSKICFQSSGFNYIVLSRYILAYDDLDDLDDDEEENDELRTVLSPTHYAV